MNQAMIDKAYDLAREAKISGQQCVMVLFPSQEWQHPPSRERKIYTRYSDTHIHLKSLPVDTLITVGDVEEFSSEGLDYIWDRMRASVNTKVILLTADWPCFTKTEDWYESV
jgi:hypothetical protein